jgi:hypothetical protein
VSATIGAGINSIRTAGFSTYGDGGHALYKRLDADPYAAWVSGTSYAFTNVRNSAGRLYKCAKSGGGASTVEPTHTSGYVLGADGYGWTFFPQPTGWFRSVDRYKADGVTIDATNGGWWELVPEGGAVHIEQFGGKPIAVGATPSTGTDTWQPLFDAIAITTFNTFLDERNHHKIKFQARQYWFSKTCYFYDRIWIEGCGGFQSDATMFFFPNNVSGFVFHARNTGPGGDGQGEGGSVGGLGTSTLSVVKGVQLYFGTGGDWATDLTKTAIFARTTINLEDVGIIRAPGKGIYFRAYAGAGGDAEGNANQWSARNIYVHSCRGDAWHVEGADVNGGYMVGFRTHTEVGGCGIKSTSYFNNFYAGLQITGYGNGGVHYGGNLYVLLRQDGSATVPGTDNRYWYFVGTGGPDFQFPTWVSGTTYEMKLPIYDSGGGSAYLNPYVEAVAHGSSLLHITGTSMSFGGTCPSTIYSNTLLGNGDTTQGVGARIQTYPGQTGYTETGGTVYVRLGGPSESLGYGAGGGLSFINHRRLSDGDFSAQWGYTGGDITYAYLNSTPFWLQTTPTTTKTFGRAAPVKNKIGFYDPVLLDMASAFSTTSPRGS